MASVLINTIASIALLSCGYSMTPVQLLAVYGGAKWRGSHTAACLAFG